MSSSPEKKALEAQVKAQIQIVTKLKGDPSPDVGRQVMLISRTSFVARTLLRPTLANISTLAEVVADTTITI